MAQLQVVYLAWVYYQTHKGLRGTSWNNCWWLARGFSFCLWRAFAEGNKISSRCTLTLFKWSATNEIALATVLSCWPSFSNLPEANYSSAADQCFQPVSHLTLSVTATSMVRAVPHRRMATQAFWKQCCLQRPPIARILSPSGFWSWSAEHKFFVWSLMTCSGTLAYPFLEGICSSCICGKECDYHKVCSLWWGL